MPISVPRTSLGVRSMAAQPWTTPPAICACSSWKWVSGLGPVRDPDPAAALGCWHLPLRLTSHPSWSECTLWAAGSPVESVLCYTRLFPVLHPFFKPHQLSARWVWMIRGTWTPLWGQHTKAAQHFDFHSMIGRNNELLIRSLRNTRIQVGSFKH